MTFLLLTSLTHHLLIDKMTLSSYIQHTLCPHLHPAKNVSSAYPMTEVFLIPGVIWFSTGQAFLPQEQPFIHGALNARNTRPWQPKMTLLWKQFLLLSIMEYLAGKMNW